MKTPRKQNLFDVMPLYRRACAFNLSLHLLFMIALLPHNLCYRKYGEPSITARNNTTFTIRCLTLLFVSNVTTLLFILLLCAGDIQPNPGPLSVASSSSGRSISSTGSNDIFSHLNLNHNLSFVQYNVQSIVKKLDIIQAELFEIDILSFTETWLNPDISTEDIMVQSYSAPESKGRPGDPRGRVVIYVKNGIFYNRILYGLFYRPSNADSQYFSNIEDSIALAIDTAISDIVITGDFNFNFLNTQAKRKIDTLCTQFSLHQSFNQPTHYTEHSSSLIDIVLVNNKDSLIFSGVGDPFLNQELRYHCPVFGVLK